MSLRPWLVGLTVVFSGSTAEAFMMECPGKSAGVDRLVAVLNSAPHCERAMRLLELCELNASGIVEFAEAVERKCEAGFLDDLKWPQKLTYKREMRACDQKYPSESGSGSVLPTALCRAKVAHRYWLQRLKAGRAGL